MPLEDFIIFLFCYVADELKKLHLKLRSRNFSPPFSDSEVITVEIVGAFIGLETDKGLWQFFHARWGHFFLFLPSRITSRKFPIMDKTELDFLEIHVDALDRM